MGNDLPIEETEQLALSDLLNSVLDRGVVLTGHVVISIADVDLVALDLRLVLSAVESALQRAQSEPRDAGAPLLSPLDSRE